MAATAASAAAPLAVERLPDLARRRVFESLPLDVRLRCRKVSPAWRNALDDDPALWLHVDLSDTSGVAAHVSDALLRAACARAKGGLLSLDLHHQRRGTLMRVRATDEALSVRLPALLAVLRANPSLQRLRADFLWLERSEDVWVGFPPEYAHHMPDLVDVRALCAAAPPGAALEVSLDCLVSDHEFLTPEDDEGDSRLVVASYDALLAALRREAPFCGVRLGALHCRYAFFADQGPARVASAMRGLLGAVAAHDSLARLELDTMRLDDVPALEALLDACVALPQLRKLSLVSVVLPSGVPLLPFFTRLVAGCAALEALSVDRGDVFGREADFVKGDTEVAAFCDALRASRTLRTLSLKLGFIEYGNTQQFADAAAGAAVMDALRDVPTFETLQINNVTHAFNSSGSSAA